MVLVCLFLLDHLDLLLIPEDLARPDRLDHPENPDFLESLGFPAFPVHLVVQ